MSHKKLTSLFIIFILTIFLFTKHETWADVTDELLLLKKEMGQLFQKGKYSEAIEIALKAVEVGIKLIGPEHPDTAESFDNLALLYTKMSDFARAEPFSQRALKITEKELGPDEITIAPAGADHGVINHTQDKLVMLVFMAPKP